MENENTLIRAARAGDRAALDAILAGYMPLCYRLAGECHARYPRADVDELIQEACIKLVDLVMGRKHRYKSSQTKRFDPDRGVKFITIAYVAVRRAIRVHANRSLRHGIIGRHAAAKCSVFSVRTNGTRQNVDYQSSLRDNCTPDAELEAVEEFQTEMSHLPAIELALAEIDPRWQKVLRDRSNGRRLREIAEEWGISRERVRQIEARAIREVRAAVLV